ncbi:MAG: hypothetical protein RL097_485 [Candidatus Parcubacteria bacterium]
MAFFSTFFVVFTLLYLLLMAFDFLPEPRNAASESGVTDTTAGVTSVSDTVAIVQPDVVGVVDAPDENGNRVVLPLTLSIPKLNRSVTVLNPTSRAVVDLDAALLEGVVRHPDSATLTQDGNVFILGHSSYLPQVFNKNFQALNGIQDLEWGDKIELLTPDETYVYRVEKVYRASAQEVTVPIAGTGKMLTLATCNSFGTVDDRYIVEAKLIETKTL